MARLPIIAALLAAIATLASVATAQTETAVTIVSVQVDDSDVAITFSQPILCGPPPGAIGECSGLYLRVEHLSAPLRGMSIDPNDATRILGTLTQKSPAPPLRVAAGMPAELLYYSLSGNLTDQRGVRLGDLRVFAQVLTPAPAVAPLSASVSGSELLIAFTGQITCGGGCPSFLERSGSWGASRKGSPDGDPATAVRIPLRTLPEGQTGSIRYYSSTGAL